LTQSNPLIKNKIWQIILLIVGISSAAEHPPQQLFIGLNGSYSIDHGVSLELLFGKLFHSKHMVQIPINRIFKGIK